MHIQKHCFAYLFISLVALTPGAALAAEAQTFPTGTLIVPMDTTFQDDGMLEAFGLVHALLRAGVPVDWAIAPGKVYGGVDFDAVAEDVRTGLPVADHGYRGGPFLVDTLDRSAADPVVAAWQAGHPSVAVHRATAPFEAEVARHLVAAPSIAIFADGREEIAFGYLNAAGIPMGDGEPWPSKRDRDSLYACPGPLCCPDCLDEAETAGPTTSEHDDGALFDPSGAPRYCQFMSMHYKHPAAVPEVVAEVRAFLQYPVHFLAECQAVNAFENAPDGRFLTDGGLLAGGTPKRVDRYQHDDPFAQADGDYASPGGSEPSYSLDLASHYHASNVVMLGTSGSAVGVDDVWMNGFVDGDPSKGKVSYLGGHKYEVALPISANPATQGTRYFLNSLFEAPCAADSGQPTPSTWIAGAGGTNASVVTLDVCTDNSGPGMAFATTLTLVLPSGATVLAAQGGTASGASTWSWSLDTLTAGAASCFEVTVALAGEGSYGFSTVLDYSSGLNRLTVGSGPPFVVRFGQINLLRFVAAYGGVVRASDYASALASRYPAEPALDPVVDLEVTAFASGSTFPHDVDDVLPGSPALVFYELDGAPGNTTLAAVRTGGKIVLTYVP